MMEALLRHNAAAGLYPGQVLASSVLTSTRCLNLNTVILYAIENIQSHISEADSCICCRLQAAWHLKVNKHNLGRYQGLPVEKFRSSTCKQVEAVQLTIV